MQQHDFNIKFAHSNNTQLKITARYKHETKILFRNEYVRTTKILSRHECVPQLSDKSYEHECLARTFIFKFKKSYIYIFQQISNITWKTFGALEYTRIETDVSLNQR